MTRPYLYAVYDADNRLIQTYAYLTWAERKAAENEGSRIATYVYAGSKLSVETAYFMNKERIK